MLYVSRLSLSGQCLGLRCTLFLRYTVLSRYRALRVHDPSRLRYCSLKSLFGGREQSFSDNLYNGIGSQSHEIMIIKRIWQSYPDPILFLLFACLQLIAKYYLIFNIKFLHKKFKSFYLYYLGSVLRRIRKLFLQQFSSYIVSL